MNFKIIYSYFVTTFLILSCLWLNSCKQIDVFEKNITIPQYQWKKNFEAKGSLIINDTSSTYNTYLVLRHTDAYKYNNIWLNIVLKSAGDTIFNNKVNITLATDENGWKGTGMNDIWEIRDLISKNEIKFKKQGNYNFSLSQIMRDEPLPNIMSVGVRVEKIKK